VIDLQFKKPDTRDIDIFDRQRMALARYLWWQLEGVNGLELLPVIHPADQNTSTAFRSCVEADSAARMFIIDGQREHAEREVKYLVDRGYADPSFIRFCKQHALCG